MSQGLSPAQEAKIGAYFATGQFVDDQSIYKTVNTDIPVLTAGKPWKFVLDKNDVANRVWLRHSISISTGATPGTPTIRRRNPAEGLGRINVTINGTPEFSVDSDLAFCIAQYFRGQQDQLEWTPLTTTGIQTASSTQNASVNIPVDFAIPRMLPVQGGMLPVGNQNITNVTFQGLNAGVVATYMDTPGATQAISTTANIPTLERQVIPAAMGDGFPGFGSWWRNQQDTPIPSTAPYVMKFTGGRRYAGIALRTVSGANANVADTVLTTGQLVQVLANGLPIFQDYPESIIGTTASALPVGFDRTGFYFLQFLRLPWKASQTILAGNQDLQLMFTATTATGANVSGVPVVLMQVADAAQARGIQNFL